MIILIDRFLQVILSTSLTKTMSTSKLWTCLSVFGILGFILLVLGVVNGQEDTKVTLTTADGEAEVVGNRRILTNVRSRRDYFYAFEGIEYATAERWKVYLLQYNRRKV